MFILYIYPIPKDFKLYISYTEDSKLENPTKGSLCISTEVSECCDWAAN